MKKLEAAGLVLIALLFFVWPLAHATVPRNLLLVASGAVFGYLAWRERPSGWAAPLRLPIALYLALLLWLLFVVMFLSRPPGPAAGEFWRQWLKSGLVFVLGAWAAATAGKEARGQGRILTALAAVLVAQVLYVDLSALLSALADGPHQRLSGAFGGPDRTSLLVNLLFALLLVEVIQRALGAGRLLALGSLGVGVGVAIALAGVYVTNARNGLVELIVMSLAVLAVSLHAHRKRLSRTAWAAAVFVTALAPVALGFVSLTQDARWRGFAETVAIAWDTETHRAWLDPRTHPLPRRANGETVDESTYLRVAWLKEGLKLVAEHPWGLGVGRGAFGRGLQRKYGEPSGNHSHSGLLDLALQGGILAVLLWIGMLAALAVSALRAYRQSGNGVALLLLALLAGFAVRMLIDSTLRDHMFKQFMLLAGMLAVMATTPVVPRREDRSD